MPITTTETAAVAPSPPSSPSDFLTVLGAAVALGVSQRRIYQEIRAGRLRAVQINDRGDWRILRQWLLDYVAAL